MIKKTPTIEEVIEYFRDAEEVKCVFDERIFKIKVVTDQGSGFFSDKTDGSNNYACLWGEETGYAEITKYKKDMKESIMNKLELEVKTPEERDALIKLLQAMPFKPKYPTDIKDVKGRNFYMDALGSVCESYGDSYDDDYHSSSRKRVKQLKTLAKLIEFREAWNKIDGEVKYRFDCRQYSLVNSNEKVELTVTGSISSLMFFGNKSTGEKFLKEFEKDLEFIKEFL